MNDESPLQLVVRVSAILDELGVPYALGGSLASSMFGEPRSTADVDVAILVDPELGEALIERVRGEFYVPVESARKAVREHEAFNLVPDEHSLKVDLFVLGDSVLDRGQIERRVHVPLPEVGSGVWVTSPEDQILRKLDWYRRGGEVSDRQWRDVVGILRVRRDGIDLEYLRETAPQVDLADLLETALSEADTA